MYCSTNITRVIKSTRMRWGRHVAGLRHRTGAYRLSVGRPDGESPLGRRTRRWEENIKTDIRKWEEGMDWINLVQERVKWRAL
jgi:hypothetical protein